MSDYLCEELIVEIFTRLPPKSLLRFRSLSKLLCSCISSPIFLCMHTFRSPQKIILERLKRKKNETARYFQTLHGEDELPLRLCPKRRYSGKRTKVPLFPCSTYAGTVGSCNGLFCFISENCLSLWNPSIRRKVSVPKYPQRSELISQSIEFGFGFDPISDDYKIVGISYVEDHSFVFALKMGTWCEIASPESNISRMSLTFLFDGVLHWLVRRHDVLSEEKKEILTFDLSTHVFGMIPLPEPICDWFIRNITTIQGSLALISYNMRFHDTWIWVWKDGSWSVVYKLGTYELPVDGALQLQPQPNNTGDFLLDTYVKELHIYNSKTKERLRVSRTFKGWCLYVETLHLLDMSEDYLLNNSTMWKS